MNADIFEQALELACLGLSPEDIETCLTANTDLSLERLDAREEVQRLVAAVSRYRVELPDGVAAPDIIVSAHQKMGGSAQTKLQFVTAREFARETPEKVNWVAEGWTAVGCTTETDGKPKASGKTTFDLHLIRSVVSGAPFLGRPTNKTAVVYLTEESDATFRKALNKAGLLDRDDITLLRWRHTIGRDWAKVVEAATEECHRRGAKLLVVDTWSMFAGLEGDKENNSGDALDAMKPLLLAAGSGLAVIINRHERKSEGNVGDSGRGSTAISGSVDIIVSIRKPPGNFGDNVRELKTLSRFDETPRELLIELTDEGYVVLGSGVEAAREELKGRVLAALPQSEGDAVTLEQIVTNVDAPRTTVQSILDGLCAEDVERTGKGKRGSPFKYYRARFVSAESTPKGGRNESEVKRPSLRPVRTA